MRRTTTLTALLLGATLLAPTSAATAAGETCRGEAATLVGTDRVLQGTDGRDVIVTGPSFNVQAGAGDDLICVTTTGAQGNVMTVDAGPGNDVMDSSAVPANYYLTAVLGDGSDTFVGGVGNDRVVAGATPNPYALPPSEAEPDVIDTGDGSDDVTSGGPGLANDDSVRTGEGEDAVTWSGTMGPHSVLDAGGDDRDTLIIRASGQTFGVDLAAQTLTRNGVREAAFSSFEDYIVNPEPDLGSIDILGTDGSDVIDVRAAALMKVDLGNGDDRLSLGRLKAGGNIELGAGTDVLLARSPEGSVRVDLRAGAMAVDAVIAQLDGVEHAYASARAVDLTGDGLTNYLNAVGCFATIDGRGGSDKISHGNYDFDWDFGYECDKGRATLRGGSGDDEIAGGKRGDRIYGDSGDDDIRTGPATDGTNKAWGGRGNDKLDGGSAKDVLDGGAGNDRLKGDKQWDVLLGGAGMDRGVGGPGRDLCSTEIRKSCER